MVEVELLQRVAHPVEHDAAAGLRGCLNRVPGVLDDGAGLPIVEVDGRQVGAEAAGEVDGRLLAARGARAERRVQLGPHRRAVAAPVTPGRRRRHRRLRSRSPERRLSRPPGLPAPAGRLGGVVRGGRGRLSLRRGPRPDGQIRRLPGRDGAGEPAAADQRGDSGRTCPSGHHEAGSARLGRVASAHERKLPLVCSVCQDRAAGGSEVQRPATLVRVTRAGARARRAAARAGGCSDRRPRTRRSGPPTG